MSRYYWDKKEEADSLKKIQIWWLKKHKLLQDWCSSTIKWTNGFSGKESSVSIQICVYGEEPNLRLTYTQTDQEGNKTDFDYKIPLTTTPCNFGGKRYWFICPFSANGRYCGRRVGVLYLGGKYFACRHCYNLTYNSRNLGGISKMVGQVISMPELDELEKSIRSKVYAGKMTRRYQRFLKKERKSMMQLAIMSRALGNI